MEIGKASERIENHFKGRAVKKFAPARHHMCAIMGDDTVECTKNLEVDNSLGDNANWKVPSDLGKVSDLSCSAFSTCAVRISDGKIICWGQVDLSSPPQGDEWLSPRSMSIFSHSGIAQSAVTNKVGIWGVHMTNPQQF